MPRNTRTYSDLDLNFIASPMNGDIAKKYDDNAIKQSVKNLVMTSHYEKPFHPEIGSTVRSLLFEPFSPLLRQQLITAITNTITNYEPRVQLQSVDVTLNEEAYSVWCQVYFKILNTQRPLSVEFTLKRTR